MAALIVLAVLVLFVLVVLARTIRVVPQARAGVVERLGRYSRTLTPGLSLVIPFVDRVRQMADMREQVVSFAPQPVITQDNLVVNIDSVIYFQITDPKAATYEIANPVNAIDLLAVTTLRNVIGGMTLEQTLTSRETVNDQLRGILDEATGKWGIRVHRVELKSVEPPASIKDTMEKQMRADREKRAAILQAEGVKQAAILQAEGEKQSAILKAEGQKQAAILGSEGQAKAIETVFKAIHEGNPDPQLLAYQYLQVLPQIAQGDANKVWVDPERADQGARWDLRADPAEGRERELELAGGREAALQHGHAGCPRDPLEADPDGRRVVVVAQLVQAHRLVDPVDEVVDATGHAGDGDVLAVEERRVAIGVAGRRSHRDVRRLRVVLPAVPEEVGMAVRPAARRGAPVVGEAEAALAIADECLAAEGAELERVEAHQVPVMVRRRVRVAELRDVRIRPDLAVCEQHTLGADHALRGLRAHADERARAKADVVDERGEAELPVAGAARDLEAARRRWAKSGKSSATRLAGCHAGCVPL